MLVAAVVARALYHPTALGFATLADLPIGVQVALLFAVVNLFLGLFNLLPIPPLDGAALLERVLPSAGCPAGTASGPTACS